MKIDTHFPANFQRQLFYFNHVVYCLFIFMEMSSVVVAQSGENSSSPPDIYPLRQTISKRMAVVLIVLICFFIFIAFLSVYTRQCTEQRFGGGRVPSSAHGGNNNRSRRGTRGLDAAVIASFPTFMYSNVKGIKIGKGSLECAVCLCEFEDDETLRLLPKCSHVFHSNCIDAWLVSHSTCPVCRASLVAKPGDISFAALLNSDSGIDVVRPDTGTHLHGSGNDQVIVRIAEDGHDHDVSLISPNRGINHQSRSMRSRSAGWRLSGLFPRSHSTGHSLIQRGDNCERFTLRLPEEVRNELLNSNLNRARSCVVLPRMQSSRQGYRGGNGNGSDQGIGKNIFFSSRSGRSDWREIFPATPFFKKEGSRRSQMMEEMDWRNSGGGGGGRPFARLPSETDGEGQQ